jgi:hypothetical protein
MCDDSCGCIFLSMENGVHCNLMVVCVCFSDENLISFGLRSFYMNMVHVGQ